MWRTRVSTSSDSATILIQAALVDRNFVVIDEHSSQSHGIQEIARFDVAVTVQLIDTNQLEFFGQSQTQYTAVVTVRANDMADGATTVGPISTTVQYTSFNLQRNLQTAARTLASRLSRGLKELTP